MATGRKRWLTDGLDLETGRAEFSPTDFPPPVPTEYRGATDSIVYRGPPPVAGENHGSGFAEFDSQRVSQFPTFDQLQITPGHLEIGGRQRSTSWLGSILIHVGIVILIAFLLAPADFGGVSTQTLVITFSEEAPEIPIPMMLVEEVASDDSSVLSEVEFQPEKIQPIDVSFEIARPSVQIGGSKTKPGKSTGNVSGGSRGSFFGIEAVGHDFVYIVDRSGSMNGMRYQRAIDELKRSVRELREDQRFLVVLFSSSSKLMFGRSSQASKMILATDENKERLEDWLVTIGAGGGTNPNSSLRIALTMNPSAVFMLSDGEFTENKAKKRGRLLEAGGDAYSIVKASGGSIPIHAIAFEDPRSCKNMKRLAELTGGEYRFVNSSGKTQSQLVAEAKDLLKQPKSKSRDLTQNALCRDFGSSQVNTNAKRMFANLLIDEYEGNYGKLGEKDASTLGENLDEIVSLLGSLITVDPHRTACADLQDKLSGELSRIMNVFGGQPAVEHTCDMVIRWRRSAATTKVLDRLVDHFVSLGRDQPEKAFARLQMVKTLHPKSEVVAVCQAVCDQITDGIVAQADKFLENDDLASAIETLRRSQTEQSTSMMKSVTHSALRELTMDKLVAARDASLSHDRDRRDEINEQLEQGFGNDPRLEQWRKEFVSREMNARRLLQQVMEGHAYSGLKLKRQQLETLVGRFPETIATRKAKVQLEQLPKWEAAKEKEEAELIRMMDDTRRQ